MVLFASVKVMSPSVAATVMSPTTVLTVAFSAVTLVPLRLMSR